MNKISVLKGCEFPENRYIKSALLIKIQCPLKIVGVEGWHPVGFNDFKPFFKKHPQEQRRGTLPKYQNSLVKHFSQTRLNYE